MAKVIISGAGGMIGTALINQLIDGGDEVIALVRRGSTTLKSRITSDKLSLLECELKDYHSFVPQITDANVFYHLAWDKTSVAGRDDTVTQAANIQFSLDAVGLAKRFGCTAFVGAGSQAEYGISNTSLNESTPVNPLSCYGIAKYSAGRLTQKLCKQLGMRHCWARILSVYGPYDGETSLIMYVMRTLLDGQTPQLTPCRQIWDYIYCDDAARALCAIGKNGKDGKIYCIGSGQSKPLREYVMDTKTYINKDADIMFGAIDYYPYQPMCLVADISDLVNDTGFTPKTAFKDGIAQTVEWYKQSRQQG